MPRELIARNAIDCEPCILTQACSVRLAKLIPNSLGYECDRTPDAPVMERPFDEV
jgi:hypothetical protein